MKERNQIVLKPLLRNLSFVRRGAAGGEVQANVKTPLLNLDEV